MLQPKIWRVMPAIIAVGIMSFSGVLIETSMNVTFPQLMTEFHTTATGVQWVTTGYLLAIAIIVPLSAYLIRNFSSRRLFIVANLLFLLGVLLDSYAPTMTILLVGRLLQGVGTGIALPLMFDIILTKSPVEKKGLMMGVGTMTTSIAPAIGPTYGGMLLNTLGWRSIFWFLIVLLVGSLILGLVSIPMSQVKRTEKFALSTFIFLAIGLGMLLLAIEQASIMWFIIAGVLLVGFYVSNHKKSLLQLNIFKNRRFVLSLYSLLVYQAVLLGLSFILPNYLQLGLHASATAAGLFMFPGAVIGAVLAPISGRVLDKLGPTVPVFGGLIVAVSALIGIAILFPQLTYLQLMIGHIVMMTGLGFSYANLMTVTLGTLSDADHADGNSVINTMQQFVGASATAVVAQIFGNAVQKSPASGVVSGSNWGVWLLAILTVVSVIIFIINQINKKK